MKQIIILGLVVLLSFGGYYGYNNFANNKSGKEVETELITHFQNYGVSATGYRASTEEQAYVEGYVSKMDETFEDTGVSSNTDHRYDGFVLSLGTLPSPVKIYVYKKTKDAEVDYSKKISEESKLRALHEKNNRPHKKKEYRLNANLIMEIDYYKNSYYNGNLVSDSVEIDQGELNKIISVFKSYTI